MLDDLSYKILYYLLKTEDPVSSNDMATYCGVSINTLRKNIEMINEDIRQHGISVVLKSSVGVYINVEDPEKAKDYFPYITNVTQRMNRIHNAYSDRTFMLARLILSVPEKASIQWLCDRMYLSRGLIMAEIKAVKELIQPYHITILNQRSEHGMVIVGNEWNIRQCLFSLEKNYQLTLNNKTHLKQALLEEKEFRAMMCIDYPWMDQLRDIVINALDEQDSFSFPMFYLSKLMNTIVLCFTRKRYSDDTIFSPEQRERIIHTEEYEFAKKLKEKLLYQFQSAIDKPELLMIASILLCFEDNSFALFDEPENYYRKEALWFAENLGTYFDMEDEALYDEEFIRGLGRTLYRLDNRHILKVVNDEEAMNRIDNIGINTGNLCLAFLKLYKERYGYALEEENELEVYYALHRLSVANKQELFAPNVLVVSEYGKDTANSLATLLRGRYHDRLGEIKVTNLKHLPNRDLHYWNLLVTDMYYSRMRRYTDHYDIPFLSIDFLSKHDTTLAIDRWLKRWEEDIKKELLKEENFYRVKLESKESVYEWIEEHFQAELEEVKLREELLNNEKSLNLRHCEEAVFLPVLISKEMDAKLAVLINHKAIQWNEKKCRIMIFYVHPYGRKKEYLLTRVLNQLMDFPWAKYDDALNDPKLDVLSLIRNER